MVTSFQRRLSGRQGKSFDQLFAALDDMLRANSAGLGASRKSIPVPADSHSTCRASPYLLPARRRDWIDERAAKRLLQTHSWQTYAPSPPDASLVDKLLPAEIRGQGSCQIRRDGEILQLAMNATEYRLGEHHYTLVSLQNIGAELEETGNGSVAKPHPGAHA